MSLFNTSDAEEQHGWGSFPVVKFRLPLLVVQTHVFTHIQAYAAGAEGGWTISWVLKPLDEDIYPTLSEHQPNTKRIENYVGQK